MLPHEQSMRLDRSGALSTYAYSERYQKRISETDVLSYCASHQLMLLSSLLFFFYVSLGHRFNV